MNYFYRVKNKKNSHLTIFLQLDAPSASDKKYMIMHTLLGKSNIIYHDLSLKMAKNIVQSLNGEFQAFAGDDNDNF